jgi:hypothetical protein
VIVGAVELDEVIRQSDSTFVRMLHEIRIGRPSPSTIEALRERTVARLDAVVDANAGTTASSATADTAAATTDIAVRSAEERSKYIVLYPHCVDVEADNRRQLNELAAPSVYYYADDYVARGQDAHLQVRCNVVCCAPLMCTCTALQRTGHAGTENRRARNAQQEHRHEERPRQRRTGRRRRFSDRGR